MHPFLLILCHDPYSLPPHPSPSLPPLNRSACPPSNLILTTGFRKLAQKCGPEPRRGAEFGISTVTGTERPLPTVHCFHCEWLRNPCTGGIILLLSLAIYSLILFIYYIELDRQSEVPGYLVCTEKCQVPRCLVCTEKCPAGGAAPAFLHPSSFSRDTPVESVIFSACVSIFSRKKKGAPHGTLPCMPWEAAGGLICTEKYSARRGGLPPSFPPSQFVPQIPLCTSILLFLL